MICMFYFNKLLTSLVCLRALDIEYRTIYIKLFNPVMIPKSVFQINQVVFIKDKEQLKPAKIISKSSYGTYKIKYFGEKEECFACQYQIKLFCEKMVSELLKDGKRTKKSIKFLKAAEKENMNFLKNLPAPSPPKVIKEQQQQDQQGCNQYDNGDPKIVTKYQAILNIKISDIVSDWECRKETIFSLPFKGKEIMFRESSKELLIKRLIWSLEDISLNKIGVNTQKNIYQILQSEVIEPVEYATSSLWRKLNEAIESLKKSRSAKLKNYLLMKQSTVLIGFQVYLNNYSVFLRTRDNFCEFLNGRQIKQKQMKPSEQIFESFEESKM